MDKIKENVDLIKKFIRSHGGIYITNRQTGKSQALLELLHEDNDSYILTHNSNSTLSLRRRYKELYNDHKEIYITHDITDVIIYKCYIDEYFFHNTYYTKFKGAVGTMNVPIVVNRLDNNVPIEDEAYIRSMMSPESYSKEFSLKFN